jgi:hypothetical protein
MARSVLICTQSSMITINTCFLSRRTILAFFLVAIGFYAAASYGATTLVSVNTTPYDNQMRRIRPILETPGESMRRDLSVRLVNEWIGSLRAIPYGFSRLWKTPSEVDTSPVADCKGKAVALYEKMRSWGATNLRLVIGKRTPSSRSTHTWLEWTTTGGETYVLDPTINWMAYKAERLADDTYVPYYAYAGSRKFRAASVTLLASN